VATFTSGAARLKYLNALGAVAEICKGLTTRGDPTGAKKENIGKQLREEFDTLLGGTEKYKDGYCDWPDSILAEEVAAGTDVSSAFTGDKIIKPDSSWNTVTDLDGTEPTFTVSDQW
jgi:hypothetical protein